MTVSDGPHLQISPTELKFRLELKKNIPVTLSLHNPGTERVGFKVKTTSPKKYCVRPSSGFVDPGTTKDVQVIMQVNVGHSDASCAAATLLAGGNIWPADRRLHGAHW